jgi:glycosyltransferase involved in cell wall biosynthesis
MNVTVCIGTVRASSLGYTVASLSRQTHQDFNTVVVGQGDDPSLRALGLRLAEADERLTYTHLDTRGLSRARNAAVRQSEAEVVAFIDDDCEAAPTWIEEIISSFSADPELGLVGGSVLPPPQELGRLCTCPSWVPGEAVYEHRPAQLKAPEGFGWMGANFALRRAELLEIGAFDEFLGAGTKFAAAEDTDLLLRCEQRGTKMLSTPRVVVTHTYGARCGVGARLAHSRNYALGNGALGGKLSLLGDPRGEEWNNLTKKQIVDDLRRGRLPSALAAASRYRHFRHGYRTCMREFEIDESGTVLTPRR